MKDCLSLSVDVLFCEQSSDLVGEGIDLEVRLGKVSDSSLICRRMGWTRHCDRTEINTPVVIAPMPPQPLPGSIATASTLAFALLHKYVDATPLYRVAQTFERAGVPISRGARAHWVIGSSEKHLHLLYDALRLKLQSQALIHGDETTVQGAFAIGQDRGRRLA